MSKSFPQYVTNIISTESYGPGWIGGHAPDVESQIDGRTYVNGELKSLTVKALDVATEFVVGKTTSADDGTWRLNLISPKRRYQVIFQNETYVDDKGDLYNSFVQDFISGVPTEQFQQPNAPLISLPIPRFAIGRAGYIIRTTINGKPAVESVTPLVADVEVGPQRDKITFKPIDSAPGPYTVNVKYVGHTSPIPVTFQLLPQPVFKQARMVYSIHPEVRDGVNKVIRYFDGVYSSSSSSAAEPRNLTGIASSFIGTSFNLSPEVPMCFVGGYAIGDMGWDINDIWSHDPGTPKVFDFWLNVREYPPAGKRGSIIHIGFDDNYTTNNPYKFGYIDSTGALYWEERGDDSRAKNRRVERIGDVVIPLNTWVHIQFQQDETREKNSQIFIDGKLRHNWYGLGLVRQPFTEPMKGENSGYTAARTVFLMSSGKYQQPDIASVHWLEGYMAKVQFHTGYQGAYKDFDPAPLKAQRVSRLYSSLNVIPFSGARPYYDHNTGRDVDLTNIGTGFTFDPTTGLKFAGAGACMFPVQWNNYSQCIEFFFNVNDRSPMQTLATLSYGKNDAGLNNGGWRIAVGGGNIRGEFAKDMTSSSGSIVSNSLIINSSGFIAGGSWVHAALTYDAVTGTLRLFYQGVLMGTAKYTSPPASTPTPIANGETYYVTLGTGRDIGNKYGDGSLYWMSGNIRGFRMTQGSPVYTAAFTPPTLAEMTADQTPCQWAK